MSAYVVKAKRGAVIRLEASLESEHVSKLEMGTEVGVVETVELGEVTRCRLSHPVRGWCSLKVLETVSEAPPLALRDGAVLRVFESSGGDSESSRTVAENARRHARTVFVDLRLRVEIDPFAFGWPRHADLEVRVDEHIVPHVPAQVAEPVAEVGSGGDSFQGRGLFSLDEGHLESQPASTRTWLGKVTFHHPNLHPLECERPRTVKELRRAARLRRVESACIFPIKREIEVGDPNLEAESPGNHRVSVGEIGCNELDLLARPDDLGAHPEWIDRDRSQ